MENSYLCSNCKRKIEGKEIEFYPVLETSGAYIPTCSIECAEIIKQENIEYGKKWLDDVRNQKLEKEKW
ncbi:hypothetical protein [Faecalimicrobium sp. JNUCC 81]